MLDVVGLDVVLDDELDVVGLDVVLCWGQLHSSTADPWDSPARLGGHIPIRRRRRAGCGARRCWAGCGAVVESASFVDGVFVRFSRPSGEPHT